MGIDHMIHVLPTSQRKRRDEGQYRRIWYYDEAPNATIINIQRPMIHLSTGPIISWKSDEDAKQSLQEYRKWLFRRLLVSKTCQEEFNQMLDILIQEGEIILQCSCIPPKPCHGNIIKNALEWAMKLGTEGWHIELKRIASKQFKQSVLK